jgi:hypothetical protein
MLRWVGTIRVGLVGLIALWTVSAAAHGLTELYGRFYWSAGDTLWTESGGDTWEVIGDQITIIPEVGVTEAGVDTLLADLGYLVKFTGPGRA